MRGVRRVVERTQSQWDDAFLRRKAFDRLAHLAPAIVLHTTAPLVFGAYPTVVSLVETGATIYMALVGLLVVNAVLNAALDIYETFEISRRIYIKGFVQVLKIILSFVVGVFVVARLLGESPIVFFSGLGAFTAVLILVFKDSILGLVAGVQLMGNSLVRRGDWIEMKKFGVDGDVLDVSLMTVTVQNWDKTIVTVPTYALVSEGFHNWRGMEDSGGRRIKRAVIIDMNTIRFCDAEMLGRYKRVQYIHEYIDRKLEEISRYNRDSEVDESVLINGRRLTNVGTFRAYLEAYLRNHPMVHSGLTFLVRHLAPSAQGLPIEIYVFSREQRWAHYEAIQADIFDHVLAAVPLFDLRVFQAPSGTDVQQLAAARRSDTPV
ncbi:MAG: mechanosensitive ion channel [Candidatus Latescibacterota bacterium]|nr:MAG: mechanosensitive ion channel [Candidatus Latescibacterota bacterium]